jgi:phospholipid/cholesterol/gamma-HCH transport system substrate-binding protein
MDTGLFFRPLGKEINNMESDARYAWVGFAVLTLILFMAGGLYWLTGSNKPEIQRFSIYFKAQSLEGLQLNSDVRMQGIKVGKVVDYNILPSQAQTVRVIIEVDARTPIWEGAEAVISRNLVTGLAAIDLDNVWKGGGEGGLANSANSANFGPPPEGEAYPVIDEGIPQMARISNTLEGLGKSGGEVIDRVNHLLSNENQQALSHILQNVVGVTQHIQQLAPEISTTLHGARQAAARLDSVGAELTPVLQDSSRFLRESTRVATQAGQRFEQLANETTATLGLARNTLSGMDGELRSLKTQLHLTLDSGLQDLQATTLTLRTTSEQLQQFGQEYADPGRLLYGTIKPELGPGEQ